MKRLVILCLVAAPLAVFSQLNVTADSSATQLAQSIAGSGVTISNAALNCGSYAAGTFSYTGSNLGLSNGIILTTGIATDASGAGNNFVSTANGNNYFDSDLLAIEPEAWRDVCLLEFDFIPICSTIGITFVFGSEEYPEYECSTYNDGFGIFLTGPKPGGGTYNAQNIGVLPNGTAVSINNVNDGQGNNCSAAQNPGYYHDNTANPNGDIAYDGYTIPVTASAPVLSCSTYHMKIGIADAVDEFFDSGVFIGSNAVSCTGAPTVAVSSTPASCGESNGSVTCSVTNFNANVTYQWLPGNQTTSTVTDLPVGTYTCIVSYAAGCITITSETVTATVVNQGNVPILSVSSASATCINSSDASVAVTAMGGTPPFSYTWNTTPPQTNDTVLNLYPGTYQVIVTDAIGCVTTATVTAGVQFPPSLQSQTQYTCGTMTTFTAPSGSNYQWYNPFNVQIGGASGITYAASGINSGQYYTVGYTDNSTGCRDSTRFQIQQVSLNFTEVSSSPCNGLSNGGFFFTTAAGNTYTFFDWSLNGASTASATNVAAPISIAGLGGGAYTVIISTTGNSTCQYIFTDTLVPNQIGPPTIDSVRACNADTIHLNPNVPGSTYNWYASNGTYISSTAGTALVLYPLPYAGLNVDTAGATYIDTIVSAAGCKSVYKAVIKAMSFQADITSFGQLKCHNDSTGKLKIIVSREDNGPIGQPYIFNWYYPAPYNSPFPTTVNPPLPVASTEADLHPGYYYCIVKAGNCVDTLRYTVINPPALPQDSMNAYYCPKDSLAWLIANPNHSPYHWLNNNVPVTAAQNVNYNNDSIQVVTADIDHYTVYYLKNGCRDSAKARTDHLVYNPFHPEVIANIFTPNQDGRNDFFYPFHDTGYTQNQIDKQMQFYELHVYDRWGLEIFQTNEYSKPWNGKNNDGTDMCDGTYFWVAKYRSNCSSKADLVEKKGFVQLIR